MAEPVFPIDFVYAQAIRTPEAPAASDGRETWNYARLIPEVDAMAAALQSWLALRARGSLSAATTRSTMQLPFWRFTHAVA